MASIPATLVVLLGRDESAGEMIYVPETEVTGPLASLLARARAWCDETGPLPPTIGDVYDELRGALGRAKGAVWRRSRRDFWDVPQGMAVTRIAPLLCDYDYANPDNM